jgi:predicted kinase
MENQPRYLFLMLGFLGSGKSYVSKWLTSHTKSVYIRADTLRWDIFGDDRPELYLPENKAIVNNAATYMAYQILESGRANVVFDANNNKQKSRRDLALMAQKAGAKTVIIYIDTPLDVAKQRTIEREKSEGHVLFEENLVEKMATRLEEPATDELTIRIDGLADAKAQQEQFDEQFARL